MFSGDTVTWRNVRPRTRAILKILAKREGLGVGALVNRAVLRLAKQTAPEVVPQAEDLVAQWAARDAFKFGEGARVPVPSTPQGGRASYQNTYGNDWKKAMREKVRELSVKK